MFDDEIKWYESNKEDLLKKYEGKFIVIKDQKVIGSFDSEEIAIVETQKAHKLGTFLVKKVVIDEEPTIYYSRVAF